MEKDKGKTLTLRSWTLAGADAKKAEMAGVEEWVASAAATILRRSALRFPDQARTFRVFAIC